MNKYLLLFVCVFAGLQSKAQICPIKFNDFQIGFNLDDPILGTYIKNPEILMPPPPPPPPPPEGDYHKIVSWVHGMNGSISTWAHAAAYADSKYDVAPLLVDYSDFQDQIYNAQFGVKQSIQAHWGSIAVDVSEAGKARSFGITHSLGGILLRGASQRFDYLDDKINGILTVDAPHGGSPLAWYVETGLGPGDPAKIQALKDLTYQTCTAFAIGPAEEFVEGNGFLQAIETISLGNINVAELLVENACKIGSSTAVPLLINNIAPPCVSELTPGADVLEINEDVISANKMLFYGDILTDPEAHNSAYKIFYSAQNSPDALPQFQASSQPQEALDELESNLNFYNDKYIRWRDTYEDKWTWTSGYACVNSSGFLWKCLTWNEVKSMRNGYLKGIRQFKKLNDGWETVTGARTYGESDIGDCHVRYEDNFKYYYYTVNDITEAECDNAGGDDRTWSPNIVSCVQGYDGFLTVESQKAWDDVPEQYKYLMEDSNHLQVKNNSETKRLLDLTFKGQTRPFFGQ